MDGGRERGRLLEVHPAAGPGGHQEVTRRSPGGHQLVTLEQQRDKGTPVEISGFPELPAPWDNTADLAETGPGDGVGEAGVRRRGQQMGSGVCRWGQGQPGL